jgi:hypothetical protein
MGKYLAKKSHKNLDMAARHADHNGSKPAFNTKVLQD